MKLGFPLSCNRVISKRDFNVFSPHYDGVIFNCENMYRTCSSIFHRQESRENQNMSTLWWDTRYTKASQQPMLLRYCAVSDRYPSPREVFSLTRSTLEREVLKAISFPFLLSNNIIMVLLSKNTCAECVSITQWSECWRLLFDRRKEKEIAVKCSLSHIFLHQLSSISIVIPLSARYLFVSCGNSQKRSLFSFRYSSYKELFLLETISLKTFIA